MGIVVDRHRGDVGPVPTFRFDADPDFNLDPNPTSSFTQVEKSAFFWLLFTAMPV